MRHKYSRRQILLSTINANNENILWEEEQKKEKKCSSKSDYARKTIRRLLLNLFHFQTSTSNLQPIITPRDGLIKNLRFLQININHTSIRSFVLFRKEHKRDQTSSILWVSLTKRRFQKIWEGKSMVYLPLSYHVGCISGIDSVDIVSCMIYRQHNFDPLSTDTTEI